MSTEIEEWVVHSKMALKWFIDVIGKEAWDTRRRKVIDYFIAIGDNTYSEQTIHNSSVDKLFKPVAVYDDWMAWYMYLIESLITRPTCDDPFQSARIYPFFAAVGRNIEGLKRMIGVEGRLKILLNDRNNKPDATLFELAVAACYHRNGWKVEFIPEQHDRQTPDFKVTRDAKTYSVECKRLAKVTDYSEFERREWQKRWNQLVNGMRYLKIPISVEIVFKVPIETTTEEILAVAYLEYVQSGRINDNTTLSTSQIDFKAKKIDINSIKKQLADNVIKENSPMLIELVAGKYDPHGSYTLALRPSEIQIIGNDDGLHILNRFIAGVHEVYAAKWECIADASIEQKAKDVKKILSKAVSQIPDNEKGIIHIGYETVNGRRIEFQRHEKIKKSIRSFNFHPKKIESIFCHAIQPLSKVSEFECAETTLFFGNDPQGILPEILLLDPPGIESHDTTHWQQDISVT